LGVKVCIGKGKCPMDWVAAIKVFVKRDFLAWRFELEGFEKPGKVWRFVFMF